MPNSPNDEDVAAIDSAFVAYALGEDSADSARAKIDDAGGGHLTPLDVQRVERMRAWITAHEGAQRKRADAFHGSNNAIAAIAANLDFIDLMLEKESAETPFLRHASVEDRQSVLTGLAHARDALKKLAARVRNMQEDNAL